MAFLLQATDKTLEHIKTVLSQLLINSQYMDIGFKKIVLVNNNAIWISYTSCGQTYLLGSNRMA